MDQPIMPKSKLFLILLALLFLTTFVHAEFIQFPNGSFETGDFTSWTVMSYAGQHAPPAFAGFCNAPDFEVLNSSVVSTSDSFKSQFYFAKSQSSSTVGAGTKKTCVEYIPDENSFSGNKRFLVDVNIQMTSTSALEFGFIINGTDWNASCVEGGTGAPLTSILTIDCPVHSSIPYTVDFFLVCNSTGGCATAPPGNPSVLKLDNFRYEEIPTMVHDVTEEGDPFPIDVNFSITDDLRLDTNNMVVSNSTCTITFDGVSSIFPFNTSIQQYEYTYQTAVPKTVSYSIGCSGPSDYDNPDANVTGTVSFVVDLSTGSKIIVTDIENVSHEIESTQVNFFPSSESQDIIYSIDNNYTASLEIPQYVFNSLIDGKQYFVYTATEPQYDANTWVFNDTLTFGVASDDPVQKIWNETTQQYEHSFTDTLFDGEKKYYKLSYKSPYKDYQSISGSTEWYTVLPPFKDDTNSISVDIYQISQYSNIRDIFIEQVPNIFNDVSEAFEIQFTAWTDTSNIQILAGQTIFESDSTTSITLTNEPHRYSVSIDATDYDSQILLKTNEAVPATIYITDYAIVPRGYFTKKLLLTKQNGDPLDLFLLNNYSKKYIQEGYAFNVKTQAYDREGDLLELKIETFFSPDANGNDTNQVTYSVYNLTTDQETILDIQQQVPPILDLIGNASSPVNPRDLVVRATLLDQFGVEVSQQSLPIKFVQFPYFGGDFLLEFFPTEKRKGKNPAGILQINSNNIETLEGLDIRIYDQNSSINFPDYKKRIYKGTDFNCITGNCSFQLKIDDFLFEDANLVHFVITGMMNTEYFSLTNPLIQVDRTIYLTQTSFDVSRIQQLVERTDQQYKNTEEIPVVLILRSTDAENLKDKLNVYLTLQNCDANFLGGGNCVNQTKKWYPNGYLFDDKYNYNLYFFRNVFLLDNGNLLPDGNYIGFRASVTDGKGAMTAITPVLAPRCKGFNYGALFWPGAFFSYLSNLFTGAQNGCTSGTTDDIVTTTVNNTQEMRIQINNAVSLTDPSLTAFGCLAPDTNNVQQNSLSQDLLCVVWVQSGKKPIDDYRLRIGNNFSDYSKTGSNKQYVEFNIPYELVAYNDPLYVKNQLDESADITTVGDYIYQGFQEIAVNILNATIIDKASFLAKNGFIPQIAGDINLDQAFSPTSVGQIFWVQIKGAPIVNAQDFKYNSKVNGNYDQINKTKFLEFLSNNGVAYQTVVPAKAKVIINDFSLPTEFIDSNGAILIDQEATEKKINQNNIDVNAPYGAMLPAKITLTLQLTMFYNSFSQQQTMSLLLNIYAFFFENLVGLINGFIGNALSPNFDPIDSGKQFLFEHILELTVLLMVIIMYRYVYPDGVGR